MWRTAQPRLPRLPGDRRLLRRAQRSAAKCSEVQIEEWAYGPRNGMYYYLRFEGNRLVKIESKRGN